METTHGHIIGNAPLVKLDRLKPAGVTATALGISYNKVTDIRSRDLLPTLLRPKDTAA